MSKQPYQDRIREKLERHFAPVFLNIEDLSGRHAGHSGAKPEGETHFFVHIVSARFATLTRVRRHQLVYEVLAEELEQHVHALSLKTELPEECASRS